jgi:hypothetical protein
MRTTLTLVAFLVLACAGCDQSVQPGASDAAVSPGTDAGGDAAAAGPQLKITYQGTDHSVTVASVAPETLDGGTTAIGLADVVHTALPGKDLTTVTAGFLGSDGFDPATKSNCATLVPISGELLARATIDPTTLNLSWAAELQYPGCLYVKGLAQVTLTDK